MRALKLLIARDDSAIAWAKRKDALCFVKIVVDRVPTPVLEKYVKAIRQRLMKREEVLLRALLEVCQDMPLRIPTKELNDLNIYRRLEEVRRCSNKELTVTRELLEKVRSLKEYAMLGKRRSFQYVSGVPLIAYNPFVNKKAKDSYFDFEQSEQLQLGVILEEGVIEPSVPQLEGQISFEYGSWDGLLKTSLVTMWELMKPSWCPNPNPGPI